SAGGNLPMKRQAATMLVGLLLLFAGCIAASAQAPIIGVQPQNQAAPPGGRALLSVGATGTAPLKYQWQRGALPVSGATNVFLPLKVVATNQTGSYRVVVSNALGSVTSAVATVTMEPTGYLTSWGENACLPLAGASAIAL